MCLAVQLWVVTTVLAFQTRPRFSGAGVCPSCSCSQSRREAEWLLLLVSFKGAVKGRWNCGRCCKPYSMSEVGVFVKQPSGDATAVCLELLLAVDTELASKQVV